MHPAIPIGTQVVVACALPRSGGGQRPKESVGLVAASAAEDGPRIRVRFSDGEEHLVQEEQLTVLKHGGKGTHAEEPEDYFAYVIYRAVIGSRAYGLEVEDSDIDRRGVFLPPARCHWRLAGVPAAIDNPAAEECYWELQRCLELALKANPTVLESLFTPLVEECTPLGQELLDLRAAFLSKRLYQSFNGFVLSQMKRMQSALDRGTGSGVKWKHAMHLIRMLITGEQAARTGDLDLDVTPHRDRLLAVKRGELPWDAVKDWQLVLHRRFEDAMVRTPLPETPDTARADAFLLRARRSVVDA